MTVVERCISRFHGTEELGRGQWIEVEVVSAWARRAPWSLWAVRSVPVGRNGKE